MLSDVSDYLPILLRDELTPHRAGAIRVAAIPDANLFSSEVSSLRRFALVPTATVGPTEPQLLPIAVFQIGPSLFLTFDRRSGLRQGLLQALLFAVSRLPTQPDAAAEESIVSWVLEARSALTLWAGPSFDVQRVQSIWTEIFEGGRVSPSESATTLKIYGSKERLVDVLCGVATATVGTGVPVLDIMSGTGAVSRALAARHPIFANDANPYAAMLTRSQWAALSLTEAEDLSNRVTEALISTRDRLVECLHHELETEAEFLHAERDPNTHIRYERFCRAPIQLLNSGVSHDLVTTRYANAYFGIAQAIEIDAIRAAIDGTLVSGSVEEQVAVAALLVAASICGSGPHFAQPPKIRERGIGGLLERRARSVIWEFRFAIGQFARRPTPVHPLLCSTCGDWRGAIDAFVERIGCDRPAAVYIDPPYSKLQYSRYYHVLNTLLSYDHPTVSGVGRYPPRSQRFSSKFEYQPKVAARELGELLGRVSAAGLTAILSYSNRGFIEAPEMMNAVASRFRRATVFSQPIRHHSQGVRLTAEGREVIEYVVVGTP